MATPASLDLDLDHPAGAPGADPAAGDDLSPLAWVHDELRRTLEGAHKVLRRFLREADAQAGSDVSARDLGALRQARAQIHQGAGALAVVGLGAAARVLDASDAALKLALDKPSRLNAALLEKIEQGSFAVIDYLGRQLAGKPVSSLLLFPQARALLEAAGAERVHPADLWAHGWQWQVLPVEAGVAPRAADAATLAVLEQLTLISMKQPGAAVQARLSEVCAELAAGATVQHDRGLWQLAAAVFEAQAQGLLQADVFSKRLASRLLAQLRGQLRADGRSDPLASERLAHDLLFFCAQSQRPTPAQPAPRLAAVRAVHGLSAAEPVDYTTSPLGRFDPALVVQARKRVLAAKDSWSAVAAGDMHRLSGLGEQFSLVGDSLRRLFPDGESLADELQQAAAQSLRGASAPRAALAMEVATGLLYLEAALEESDFAAVDKARPIARLAERIGAVRAGGAPEPMEAWMETLYARVSDRQTLGSVVQELRASLAAAEQHIDQFFRNPNERGALLTVPGTLQSMRGVLSVLGIDQAALALQHMREEIDALARADDASIDDPSLLQARFERLAGNLGALGFLIDMLAVQAPLARSLFRFDGRTGTLAPVMGRAGAPPPRPVVLPVLQDVLELPATPSTPPSPHETTAAPPRDFPATAAGLLPVPAGPPTSGNAVDDAEMRAVFIEEAQEVLQAARVALADWHAAPRETDAITRLRRAFHTLKGSARMVGLGDFGEAAWALEQAYNARLADNTPQHDRLGHEAQAQTDAVLRGRTGAALEDLRRRVGAIAEGGDGAESHPAAASGPVAPGPMAFDATAPLRAPTSVPAPPDDAVAAVDAESVADGGLDLDLDLAWGELPPPDPSVAETTPGALAPVVPEAPPPPLPDLVLDGERPADPEPPLDLDFDLDVLSGPVPSPDPVPPALAQGVEPEFELEPEPEPVLEPEPEPEARSPAWPLGLPPDLPTAADLDLSPPARRPEAAEPEPAPAPSPEVADTDAWVEDIGRSLLPSPAPAVDLSFISLDLSEPLPMPPPVEPPSPPAEPPRADVPADPPAAAVVELDTDEDPSLLALFDGLGEAPAAAEPVEPTPDRSDDGAAGLDLALDAQALPAADVTELDALPDDVVETAPGVLVSLDEDENVKLIGTLRIGIPLFNIYLNEADELSRRLGTELAEWSLERHLPVPDAAVERAHSLAGNSATVGYVELCELARALEHALARVQAIGLRGVAGREDDARLFIDASDEIRRLLHQFAAGFLKSPSPELLARLAAHEAETEQRLEDSQAVADGAGVDAADWLAGIEAVDKVDPDLFPIFEEEAQDLLPQLAAALRDWARRPDDLGAADGAMRHLHTFKGGARLAGAMRLGELAHRLETRIERLATGGVVARPADVEALLAGSDALQHAFEALRESDAEAYAAADAQAIAASQAAAPLAPLGPLAPDVAPADRLADDPLGLADAALSGAEDEAVMQRLVPASTPPAAAPSAIDWARFAEPPPLAAALERGGPSPQAVVRVRAALLERMVNQAGEVNISRARIEVEMGQVRSAVTDLTENLERLRQQLHDIELQAETQMSSRIEATKAAAQEFDPLEIDRFTRFQELTRMMAESVNDVATVQRTLKRTVERAEDELAAQTRLTRDLQADLLRTRMVEFDTLAERLHRVVRQAAKETDKQVRLDIVGGGIELDRGMLDRLTPAFEHLLRNAVTHGIESPAARSAAGKAPVGLLTLGLSQQGNEVGIELGDDGAGLDLARIRAKAAAQGIAVVEGQEAELIFTPGFSTAERLTELAGRGVGLDVVRTEVMGVGGRVEVTSAPGQGTRFSLLLPLTTAVTQVLMLRCGDFTVAVPATLVDRVRRVAPEELMEARSSGRYAFGDQSLPFHWLGALLQHSGGSSEPPGRSSPVVIVRSAHLRLALHVDEVLGHQEAVVKPLGPQLSRMPGLAGMSVLASGTVALIYNPLVLAAVYGEAAQALSRAAAPTPATGLSDTPVRATHPLPAVAAAPLVLVVDDSLTVRRVTQRLLVREGYRVSLAKDGLEALERIAEERPQVVLSDIEMPRMDGFELVRSLRADAALQDLPVVMISSRIAQKHREHATALGVDHYLGKPYGQDELLALVARYTRRAAPPASPAAPDLTTA